MRIEQILPTTMILLNAGSAAVYLLVAGNIRMFLYWSAAAVLTAAITF